MKETLIARAGEISTRVSLCSDSECIEINGRKLRPDVSKAYVEIFISHSWPVVTSDLTALHPAVVANSFESMRHQVFNFLHIMKAYDPESNPRDRIIGSIVDVEFPPTPIGGWKVQAEVNQAPGIRAVASVFKRAEGVDRFLGQHLSGRRKWTVSMEQEYFWEDSGFLVACGGDAAGCGLQDFEKATPADLRAQGQVWVPALAAPEDLTALYKKKASKMSGEYRGRKAVALLGGLDKQVHYYGVGATPLGKEPTAELGRVLASGFPITTISDDTELTAQILDALKKTAALPRMSQ